MSLNCRHALTHTVGLKSKTRHLPLEDAPAPVEDTTDEQLPKNEECWIICRQCRQLLSKFNERVLVNGFHRHTFANPSGLVFEIGCYAQVRGCMPYGSPSNEFAWFANHTWQIILCAKCLSHLGWLFSSTDGRVFFGLIVDRISEEIQRASDARQRS